MTSSPAASQASTRWRPANPVAPVMNARNPLIERNDVFRRAVAVGGRGRRIDRLGLGVGRVQATLELAHDGAEEQVAPGRLGERAAGAPELRKLVARRVHVG